MGSREAGGQQPEPEGKDKLGPRDGIRSQTVSRLPVANQVFLGSWTVDIRQEGRRDQLPKDTQGTPETALPLLRRKPAVGAGQGQDAPPPGQRERAKHRVP